MVRTFGSHLVGEPGFEEVGEVATAVVRGTVSLAGLRDFYDSAFGLLPKIIAGQGAAIIGPAFCVHLGAYGDAMDLEIGFAVDRALRPQLGVQAATLPAGLVARLVHVGGFEGLSGSWDRLRAWIEENGHVAAATRWEVYITRPTPDMDPAELRTELNWLVDAGADAAA